MAAHISADMLARFTKMHGCGNDFVILDERKTTLGLTAAQAAAIADRHLGVGCDQVIVLEPPPEGADVFMRIRNPDGSESGACGNATRCVASLVAAETGRAAVIVQTIAGALPCVLADGRITVDMGPARLGWQDIPLARAMDTLWLPLPGEPAACSMGNPHATWFVDAMPDDGAALGAARERDRLFPQRANIGFAQVLSPEKIRVRVWERGTGFTLSCGSGACATLVNAARRGLTGRAADIVTDGGTLHIFWRDDNHVLMAGPVATVFSGTLDMQALPA